MKKLMVLLAGAALASAGFGATYNIHDGETFVITNNTGSLTGCDIINAYGGATIVVPTTKTAKEPAVYPRICILGGTVTISNSCGAVHDAYWFCDGLRTKVDGGVNGKVRIVGAKQVLIGRNSVGTADRRYPICELDGLEFDEQENNGVRLCLKSTLRRIPAGVALSIDDDAIVALQGDASLLDLIGGTDNALTLDRFDVISCTLKSLPEGCRVNVKPGRTFTFRPSSANAWDWSDTSASTGVYDVRLEGKGAKVQFRGTGVQIRCESDVSGEGEIVFHNESTGLRTFYRNISYVAEPGKDDIVLAVSAASVPTSDSWQKKVVHWFDASATDTQILLDFDCTTHEGWENVKNEYNGHPIIMGLKDVKKGTDDIFLYNSRIFDNGGPFTDSNGYVLQTTPYLVRGGLNGLDYISCGKCNVSAENAKYGRDGQLASANEVRRLRFWKGEASGHELPKGKYVDELLPYCIMVFNSANGGGKATLGTRESTVTAAYGNLARANSSTSYAWTGYDGFSMVVDGRNVNPKSEKPKGRWQIVSIDMSATNAYVNAIGRHQTDTLSGGQDYAEVIFFSEKPTPSERCACELYLAKKWGLESSYSPRGASLATLTGKSNAKVILSDTNQPDYDSDAAITVDGDFTGTIEVPEGRTLVVSDKPVPPTEADVPETGRVGWFDPSFAESLDLYGALSTETACKDGVRYLYSRTATMVEQPKAGGPYVLCANDKSPTAPNNGRYPYKVEGANGVLAVTPTMPWMDFSKQATSGDTLENTIRLNTAIALGGSSVKVNIRQAFLALDTSKGGGNPIGDEIAFSGTFKPRANKGAVASDPIWATGSSAATAITTTWLDTTAVDPTKGFNGRGEVLSFESASAVPVRCFGYYNVGKGNEKEVIGEILLYSSPLSDAERLMTQEYLMYKWFGDLNGKYSDLTKATVTGAGNVRVASPAALATLPVLSEDFTGAIEFGGETLALTAGETVEVPRKVALPEVLTVDLTAAPAMDFGEYTLLTAAGGIDGATTVVVRLAAGSDMTVRYRVKKVGSSLVLTVTGRGVTILLK